MDIDPDREAQKVKVGLILVGLFIMSTFYSCEELKFATSAKTTEAVFEGVRESPGRRGRVSRMVQYHFHDDTGELRKASAPLPDDFVAPQNSRLKVEYIADSSRLAGERNMGALVMFFGLLLAMIVAVTMFVLHVRRETRPASRGRTRR